MPYPKLILSPLYRRVCSLYLNIISIYGVFAIIILSFAVLVTIIIKLYLFWIKKMKQNKARNQPIQKENIL